MAEWQDVRHPRELAPWVTLQVSHVQRDAYASKMQLADFQSFVQCSELKAHWQARPAGMSIWLALAVSDDADLQQEKGQYMPMSLKMW